MMIVKSTSVAENSISLCHSGQIVDNHFISIQAVFLHLDSIKSTHSLT